jgi:hypothetical protein
MAGVPTEIRSHLPNTTLDSVTATLVLPDLSFYTETVHNV